MKKKIKIIAMIVIIIIIIIVTRISLIVLDNNYNYNDYLSILSSSENDDLEYIVDKYNKKTGEHVRISYRDNAEIIDILNNDTHPIYDAVWLSSSIWESKITTNSLLTNGKSICINPIVFAISETKYNELGLANKKINMAEIISLVNSKKIKLFMPNIIETNCGASMYLSFLNTLVGNPEVMTIEQISKDSTKENLKQLLGNIYYYPLGEPFELIMFSNEFNYDCFVNYESSIINTYEKYKSRGKHSLRIIYPTDGIFYCNSPFYFLQNKFSNNKMKKKFEDFQKYLLSDEIQNELANSGRRSGYGGIFKEKYSNNEDAVLTAIEYPKKEVISEALKIYQENIRKPYAGVFCLDYADSTDDSDSYDEMIKTLNYILDEDITSCNWNQFSDMDEMFLYPYSEKIITSKHNEENKNNIIFPLHINGNKDDTKNMLDYLKQKNIILAKENVFSVILKGLKDLNQFSSNDYLKFIVILSNRKYDIDKCNELYELYQNSKEKIPIYLISSNYYNEQDADLVEIIQLSGGEIFYGHECFLKKLRETREIK